MTDFNTNNLQSTECVQKLLETTAEILTLMKKSNTTSKSIVVYSNKEVMQLLQVNTNTLRKYRDDGELSYSKVGEKFFYTENDINKFLNRNHYKAYRYE